MVNHTPEWGQHNNNILSLDSRCIDRDVPHSSEDLSSPIDVGPARYAVIV
jgi:hypothetical protein